MIKTLKAALMMLPLLMVTCTSVTQTSESETPDYTVYVNPFIGTQTDETGALSGRRIWINL